MSHYYTRRFWELIPKVLPTVYEDSLSYYEVLNKLLKIVGEIAETLDDIDPDAIQGYAESADQSAQAASASAQLAHTYEEGASESARTEVGLALEPWVSAVPGDFVFPEGLDIPLTHADLWVGQSGYTVMISAHLIVLDASEIESDPLPVIVGRIPKPSFPSFITTVGTYPAFIDRGVQGLIPCIVELEEYTEGDDTYWGISVGEALEDNDHIYFSLTYPTSEPIDR